MTSRLVEQQMSEEFAGLNPITSNDDDEIIDESNSNLAPIASSANGRNLGKLKITDQLVASVEKVPVPNHILNTKIYAKLQRNQIFEVAPGEIHFAGFQVNVAEPNKRYSQTLHVINISDKVQRMTVLPPMTRNFDVFYVKQERLVPGFALDITVYFKPDEYKYYNDAIRIHTEDEENLFIPVHAYPIISNYDFPTKYSFPNLPVGKSITRVFNLRSTAPIEFEFLIEILEKHPAFKIEPLEGIIPFDRDVEIRVTFSPKEFSTAIMKIQLVVSQFNSKPIVCSFYGSSIPGLARDKYYSKYAKLGQIGAVANSQKPASLTPPSRLDIDDSSQEQRDNEVSEYYEMPPPQKDKEAWKHVPKTEIGKDVAPKREQFVDFDGFRFPMRLDNPWAVGKVLNQSKGKVSMKELKSNKKSTLKLTAQAKEAIFLKKVNELEDEERRNQLKWQVKLGESIIDEQTRQEILASRAQAVYEYKLSIGVPFPEIELKRDKTIDIECRSVRDHTLLGKNDITFDPYKNQLWKLRLISLEKFVQSARKIIIRNRLIKVLASLKKFAQSWNEAVNETIDHDETNTNKLNIENYIDIYCKKLKGENLDELGSVKSIHVRNMGTSYFAQVDEFKEFHEQKARHCEKLESILKLDSLGAVAVKSIDFDVPHETPYIGLAIPVNYKLNSYRTLFESSYVPKFEQRWAKLRLGAEDELSHHQVVPKSVEKTTTTTNKSEPTKVVASTSRENTVVSQQPKIVDLVPGKHLSEPIEYPPFHIFNPTPGIMSYQKTLPYSGVDLNFHLNPLPRFDRDQIYPTQRKFLDREDVIKGSNSWKKFPSQGLQSLANTPTLTDVWIPRWTNTFGTDLLPLETPPLLTGLPEDDKQDLANLDTDSSTQGSERDQSSSVEKKIYLTPEMVNAQFNIPSIFEVKEKNAREEAIKPLNKPTLYRPVNFELQFPYGEKLPANNTSASLFGQVERDRREQELEYFLGKQNNAIGHKIQNRFVSVEKQYVQQQQQSQQQQQPVQSLTIIQEQQQQ